jgi:hypothetical protein
MCEGGNGGGTPTLLFSNSFEPRNCCGLVPALLTTCNINGYRCPLGCKGNKGCGSVKCTTRLRPNVIGEPYCEHLLICKHKHVKLLNDYPTS